MVYIFYVKCTSSYSVYIREVNLKNVSISHLIKMIRHFVLQNMSFLFLCNRMYLFFKCKICFSFSMQSDILPFFLMQHISFFFHAIRISFSFFSNAKYVFLFLCNRIYLFFFQMKLDHKHYISLVRCVYIYIIYVHCVSSIWFPLFFSNVSSVVMVVVVIMHHLFHCYVFLIIMLSGIRYSSLSVSGN